MLKPKLVKGSCSIPDRAGSLVLFGSEKSGGDGFARPVKLTTVWAETAIAVESMSKDDQWGSSSLCGRPQTSCITNCISRNRNPTARGINKRSRSSSLPGCVRSGPLMCFDIQFGTGAVLDYKYIISDFSSLAIQGLSHH